MAARGVDEATEAAVFIDMKMNAGEVGKNGRQGLVFAGVEPEDFQLHEGGGDFRAIEVEGEFGLDAGHDVGLILPQFVRHGIRSGFQKGGAFGDGGIGVGLDVKVGHGGLSIQPSVVLIFLSEERQESVRSLLAFQEVLEELQAGVLAFLRMKLGGEKSAAFHCGGEGKSIIGERSDY